MKRIEQWEKALHDFVESRVGQPFEWGANDCALFTCDAVQALTGVDIAGDFRGQYSTQLGAVKTIREATGGSTVEDAAVHVTAQQGMAELPSAAYAHRGDVVLFDGAEGPALGIVWLNGTHAALVGESGLRLVPVMDCRRAWRVDF